ncbi:hypothetical protein BT93_F0515 [Corymbia citriodora subsp. variegata]|nr:hypothetical protein BT93_F0515 [Corymbia citriodora subsp. variegata]KAF8023049.1 hypothetical protein BT93_F0515 [Corymbia citriodora subsp. variegata]
MDPLDPSNFYHGGDFWDGASAELPEPDYSVAEFAADVAAAVQSPLSFSLGDGDFLLKTIDVEMEALEKLDREFQSRSDIDIYFSNSDQQVQHRGVEHTADDWNQADHNLEEATATQEYGSNNFAGSVASSIHRRDHRASNAEGVASSQQVSAHSFNHGKDELDRFKNQEHSLVNLKSSQGASCTTLPEAIHDEDETQSTSGANIDGQELESDSRVPRVGMVFFSEEAVYDFYNNYAKQTGFNVRRGKAEYSGSNKAVIKAKYFLCSCQGHKSKEQIDKPTRYKRRDTRTGCDAKIKCMVNDGTWKISKVVLEHNHDLKGCFTTAQGRVEDAWTTTALSTEKIADEVRMAREHDHSGISQGTQKNRPLLELEATQDLIDHFKNMQIQDPSFFYTAQVEAAHGMANVFWRDSRSKVDYDHFGDVLVLDTRTRINKYDMTCTAFWGLNHHRQHIIFGCAFLVDQTVGSFNWLLQTFLMAMSWQKPQTIITEVSEEIADAVRVVLPETSHCLPFWSILNSFDKYLSPLSDRPGVNSLFGECVFHVHSEEEFELKWNCFVGKSKLHENAWVASLYGMRKKWSHVSTKNVFSAGLLSIQNDEDARAVFGILSCEAMTLSQIAHQCGKVVDHIRKEEFLEDKHCEENTTNLIFRNAMEKEAECLYTRPMFRMFQEELINVLSLAIDKSGGTAILPEFKLTKEGSTKIDTVKFDTSSSTLVCSCGKFESVGILCSHALKVLNSENIFKIPSRYLLKRWTKSAKDSLPVDICSTRIARDNGPANSFIGEFMRKALHVAHICATKKRERIALKSIDLALKHIAKVPRTEEIAVARDDSDSEEDMVQTICNNALETLPDQGNVAKSGMGYSKVKRKAEGHRPARKQRTGYTRQPNRGLTQSRPKRAHVRAQVRPTSMSDRRSKHAD